MMNFVNKISAYSDKRSLHIKKTLGVLSFNYFHISSRETTNHDAYLWTNRREKLLKKRKSYTKTFSMNHLILSAPGISWLDLDEE